MSFIKSIVGWFKRKKPEFKTSINPDQTYKPNPFGALVRLSGLDPVNYQLKGIDRDIEETLKAIAAAEKSKKKRSHLKSKHRALKLQRLQIENKISDRKLELEGK